jgi:hypothetical protein
MVLVHLLVKGVYVGEPWHNIFAELTRFAAGGFIFVAGMSVGRIFLPRAQDPARRGATYRALVRRAFYVLAVHYTATLAFMISAVVRGIPLPPVWSLVTDVVLLQEGYDLLPFYVVMLLVSPLLIELVRRRLGVVLGVISIGLFMWGGTNYYVQAIPIQQTFYVVLWQLIFVMGLLAGAIFHKYDALTRGVKIAIAVVSTVAMLVLGAMAHGHHVPLLPPPDPWWFVKVPLATGAALRYLAIIVAMITVTDLLWRYIGGTRVESFVGRLGRRALAMYIAHIVITDQLVPISEKIDVPPAWKLIYFPIAVAMLWIVAYVMDWLRDHAKRRAELSPAPAWQFQGWPVALTAVIVVIILGISAHVNPKQTGRSPYTRPPAATPADEQQTMQRTGGGGRYPLPAATGILRQGDRT